MRRVDLERMIMDPEGLKQLGERAVAIQNRYGNSSSGMLSIVRAVELGLHTAWPTSDEVRANNADYTQQSFFLADIGRFLPELRDSDPKSALDQLIHRYRENDSEANQSLVIDAINRLTTAGLLDTKTESLVEKAIKVIAPGQPPNDSGKASADAIMSMLYEHPDQNGRRYYAFLSAGNTNVYEKVRWSSLSAVGLNDAISSLTVEMSVGEAGGEVILFEHDRFFGRYNRVVVNSKIPKFVVPFVGRNLNDSTSSVLLIRHFHSEVPPIPLGELGLHNQIKKLISNVPDISLRGDPIVTWDMWPEGPDDEHPNDPTAKFIYLRIPVTVEIEGWFDYDAEIWYWIYPYISGGKLLGHVAYIGAWVAGGILTGSILDNMIDRIRNKVSEINAQIAPSLELVNNLGPFERLYLLPGNAANLSGHTDDDVSLVLVKT